MKIHILICATCFFGICHINAASRPTTPFPVPHFTAQEAIQKVTTYYTSIKGNKDWQIISLKFGDPDILFPLESGYFDIINKKEWCWFIIYANPKSGDMGVYQLTNDGKIHPLGHVQT